MCVDTAECCFADVDEYNSVYQVRVELWVLSQGQSCTSATGKHNTISISSDSSVTLQDNPDGGVDVYDAGNNNVLQPKAFTIYNGGFKDSWACQAWVCSFV